MLTRLHSVTFEGIEGIICKVEVDVSRGGLEKSLIVGLPESQISVVVLKNVSISAPIGLTVRNAKGIKLKNVKIETQHGQPFILENAEVEGLETAER